MTSPRGWLRDIGVTDPLAALDAVRQIGGKVSDNAPSDAQVGDKVNPDTHAAANADMSASVLRKASRLAKYMDANPHVIAALPHELQVRLVELHCANMFAAEGGER